MDDLAEELPREVNVVVHQKAKAAEKANAGRAPRAPEKACFGAPLKEVKDRKAEKELGLARHGRNRREDPDVLALRHVAMTPIEQAGSFVPTVARRLGEDTLF